jgi:hypothetical protein
MSGGGRDTKEGVEDAEDAAGAERVEGETPMSGGRDERLDLWLDGELSDEERGRFEEELERDPGQRAEAESLATMLALMKDLPVEKAPGDILGNVQSRLRERTGGRVYAGPNLHARFPYEVVIQSFLLIGAVLVFALASPRQEKLVPVTSADFLVSGSEIGMAVRVLSDYAKFSNEHPGVDANGWRHLVGDVANTRLEALRAEISLYPAMRIESEDPVPGGLTRVRVGVRP